jgi:catechol 2,3-dioxygenase-like lactoylglutathione lyase family enzyme
VRILGPDQLIFGVEDLDACIQCASDYGLKKVESGSHGATFEALDGTGLLIRRAADASLAPASAPSPNLRDTLYGVADQATLDAVGAELAKDREVRLIDNRVLRSTDADGYPISFQVTQRRPIVAPHVGINVPGQVPGRFINEVAALDDQRPVAYSLSHVVMFTRDKLKSEQFYAERLGFRTVDVFTNLGPFMRPAGTYEHHTLFLIQSPGMGVQHFTFHFAGANELLKAGWAFQQKGYKSFWGPGRHIFGSNYFWYFNSPFGGLIELDADMDLHDDSWVPRHAPANADTSQTFLCNGTEKWSPRGKH